MSREESNVVYLKQTFETFKTFFLQLVAENETELFDNFTTEYNSFYSLLELYNLNPTDFIVKDERKLFESMEINSHDDQNICALKTFILLFFYGLSNMEKNSQKHLRYLSKFSLFVNEFIVNEILSKVFECNKRIYDESIDREIDLFESGIETLEKNVQLILHLYIRLLISLTDSKCNLGIGGLSSTPSKCILLAVSLYFCEKKEKFLNENSGQLWNVAETEVSIMKDLIRLSNFGFHLIDPLFQDESENFADSERNITKLLFERLYYLAELTNETNDEMQSTISYFLSGTVVNDSNEMLISLMEEDFKLVEKLDDSKLITNELISDIATDNINYKRNIGKQVYIIKIKLLRFLTSLRLAIAKGETDLERFTTLENSFKKLIIDSLNKECVEQSGSLLAQQVIETGLVMISQESLNEESLQSFPEESVNYIHHLLSIYKQLLLSSNATTRSVTLTFLNEFLETTEYYSDDLIAAILKSHEFINDVEGLYKLLGGVAESVARSLRRDNIDKKIMESFELLIRKAFNNICENDSLEYLKDVPEENRLETHNRYIERYFRMAEHIYTLAKDLLEPILKFIQKKVLDLEERKDLALYLVLPPFAMTLKGICRSTERSKLLETFKNLNYYEFLVHFIEIYIRNDSDFEMDFEMKPIFGLLGCLSDLRIFHTHFSFYRNKQSGEKQDFLHDYILPFIAKCAIVKPRKITNYYQPHQAYIYNTKLSELFKAIQRIVINDIALNADKTSYPILEEPIRLISKRLPEHISLFEDKLDSEIVDEKNQTLFGAILILLGRDDNLDDLTQLLYYPYLYEISPSYWDSTDQYLLYKISELIEYALDKEVLPNIDELHDWLADVVLLIPKCVAPLVSLVKRVVHKMDIRFRDTKDEDDMLNDDENDEEEDDDDEDDE